MSRARIGLIALFVALLVSNGWLVLRVLDAGITQTYMSDSVEKSKEALDQTLALLPVVAKRGASKGEVIAAAQSAAKDAVPPFEKDGYVWVGGLGLKFDKEGNFVKAVAGWSE